MIPHEIKNPASSKVAGIILPVVGRYPAGKVLGSWGGFHGISKPFWEVFWMVPGKIQRLPEFSGKLQLIPTNSKRFQ
jgi:hypothetical protein